MYTDTVLDLLKLTLHPILTFIDSPIATPIMSLSKFFQVHELLLLYNSTKISILHNLENILTFQHFLLLEG